MLDRNALLIDAIHGIFDLPRNPSEDDLRGHFSNARIRELYEFVERLWPPNTDVYALLPDVGSASTAYFVGEPNAADLLQNVLRISLYVDRILVLDPFTKSWNVKNEFRPTSHPDQHQSTALRLTLWVLALESWIRSGIVTIIPDPADFDAEFRSQTTSAAIARMPSTVDSRDFRRINHRMRQEYGAYFITMPNDFIERASREQGYTDEQVARVLEHVEHLRRLSPFPDAVNPSYKHSQLISVDTGGPIEDALLICHLTGAFPYTNLYDRRRELTLFAQDLPNESSIWTPLSNAFSDLDFKFLNNIDVEYVEQLRHEDRPSMMRQYLRRLWRSTVSDQTITDAIVKDFTDELAEQYRIAKEQWDEIAVSFEGSTLNTGIAAIVTSLLLDTHAPLVAGHLAPMIPYAGFAATTVAGWFRANRRAKNFRRNVPLSIFVELSDA